MERLLTLLLSLLSILQCTNTFSVRHQKQKREGRVTKLPLPLSDVRPVYNLFRRKSEEGRALSHLVILIHGFNSRPDVWSDGLAELILTHDQERKCLGVLVVDWQEGSKWINTWDVWTDYSHAVKNTRCLAKATALLVQKISHSVSVHCVGHSLGAHVCGFIGNMLEKSRGEKMARITGLDPAGIDWTTVRQGIMQVVPLDPIPHADTRLDAGDAHLVDVIHTDGNFAGTMVPLGHVDFYIGRTAASLGSSQKGCGCTDNCDHATSFRLFAESVKQPVSVTTVLSCEGPRNYSLFGCEKQEGMEVGYYYGGGKGVVGVLIESEGPEMPCAEEEEGDWGKDDDEDWDDWDDKEDEDKEEVEDEEEEEIFIDQEDTEDAVDKEFDFNRFLEPSANVKEEERASSNRINSMFAILAEDFTKEASDHPDILNDAPSNTATTNGDSPRSEWSWSVGQSECGPLCISLISSLVCFFLLGLLICLCGCSKQSYLRLHTSKESL